MLPVLLAVIMGFHGAVHLIGFAKAFQLVPSMKLDAAISRTLGMLWLVAGVAYIAAAIMLFAWPAALWAPALLGIFESKTAFASDWRDAKYGTVVNVIILVPLVVALLDLRSSSLRSTYRHEVDRGLSRESPSSVLTESDIATLPPLLQTYLRRTGSVGRPRVHDLRARWRGQMRNV
jgi:hypothetical protein